VDFACWKIRHERGIRLYRRMGYQIEGTRVQAALIEGRFQDELFIAKILKSGAPWRPPVLDTDRLHLSGKCLSRGGSR